MDGPGCISSLPWGAGETSRGTRGARLLGTLSFSYASRLSASPGIYAPHFKIFRFLAHHPMLSTKGGALYVCLELDTVWGGHSWRPWF